ncbi:MAG TPA: glycosyltransferase [Salinisphaeraceae bacterium]|nr:glycosyltransferase [Salinisphaeraceae bacterium]
MSALAGIALLLWLVLLLLPWQPWRCRERLEPAAKGSRPDGRAFTVLIPARNEADVIAATLAALVEAAPDNPVIVVDDQSTDATASIVRARSTDNVRLLAGTAPPAGWSGKLWALEQGLQQVETQHVLLLDADIRLAPGMAQALLHKARAGHALVSVLAEPCWQGFWARWLLPAYVYFFKLIYPFALVNKPHGPMAAAAGGVALVECAALRQSGGFAAWRGALIDDCAMARHLQRAGYHGFLGLSHGAISMRRQNLRAIITMVARTAFVQLHESWRMLLGVSALMALAYIVPVAVAIGCAGLARGLGLATWALLAASYLPVLHYYRFSYWRNPLTALLLPAVAALYLGMTWFSALRALSGTRSTWKGRHYCLPARKEHARNDNNAKRRRG